MGAAPGSAASHGIDHGVILELPGILDGVRHDLLAGGLYNAVHLLEAVQKLIIVRVPLNLLQELHRQLKAVGGLLVLHNGAVAELIENHILRSLGER